MKHLLGCDQLTYTQAIDILDTAEAMAASQKGTKKKLPVLAGQSVATLFFEDSTRTRLSFETAARRLSLDVISFSAKGSSLSKGESLKDTAQTIVAMGAGGLIVRNRASGTAELLAHRGWVDVPIINAGDGTHQHPTQALLDAFTLRRHFYACKGNQSDTLHYSHLPQLGKDLAGAHVVIVGDILHSRVARSNVQLLTLLGAHVTLVAPPTLLPLGVETWPVRITYDFDEALAQKPDAVMMLRIQHERMERTGGGFFPSAREYTRLYGLDRVRVQKLKKNSIIMHPGPMNRGLEITAEAADSPFSVVTEQVANGISIRMAVLYLLLAHE